MQENKKETPQSSGEALQSHDEELETDNEDLLYKDDGIETVNKEPAASHALANAMAKLELSEKRYRLLVDNMNEAFMLCKIEYGPDKQPMDLVIDQVNGAFESLLGLEDCRLPMRAGASNLFGLVSGEVMGKYIKIIETDKTQEFEVFLNEPGKNLMLSVYSAGEGQIGIICRDDTECRKLNAVTREMTMCKATEAKLSRSRDILEDRIRERSAVLHAALEELRLQTAEREKTQLQLRQLSKVFMAAGDPIIIEDLNRIIVDVNRAAVKTYGYAKDELVAREIDILIPESGHEFVKELRKSCLNGEVVRDWEGLRQDRYGNLHEVLVTAFTLLGKNNKPDFIVTIATDISSLKQMQKELEKRNKQLSRLTSELTLTEQRERKRLSKLLHDHLQQYLIGVKMKLELLPNLSTIDQQKEFQPALNLIIEAINTSRSLAAQLSPPVLFLQGLIDALKWLAGQMIDTHYLTVDVRGGSDASPPQEELRIILYESIRELLLNVVKHAHVSTATVHIQRKSEWLHIKVSDNGDGFDTGLFWDHISDTSVGFGLFHIRERLMLIGGAFEIDSSPGKGTTVRLISPLQTPKFTKLEREVQKDPVFDTKRHLPLSGIYHSSPKAGKDPIRLMVVDNYPVVRQGLSAFLKTQPDIDMVAEAADGLEAVELAEKCRPDIILMDISMPGMDGIEATRRICANDNHMAVIGVSMHDDAIQKEKMAEAGGIAVISKSDNLGKILDTVRRYYHSEKSKKKNPL